jgi:antibiotic biosynthesis monooxygenase
MQILAAPKSILVALATVAVTTGLIVSIMTARIVARVEGTAPPLIVRVAVFSAEQGRLDDYRDFVEGHLFPSLRTIPGYVGIFLGRSQQSGQLISLSFWRSEADAVAGEEAVGRIIRALPPGSAPRPSKVEKYVVEYRDLAASVSK